MVKPVKIVQKWSLLTVSTSLTTFLIRVKHFTTFSPILLLLIFVYKFRRVQRFINPPFTLESLHDPIDDHPVQKNVYRRKNGCTYLHLHTHWNIIRIATDEIFLIVCEHMLQRQFGRFISFHIGRLKVLNTKNCTIVASIYIDKMSSNVRLE